MTPLEDAVEVGDATPSIIKQAQDRGWRGQIMNFGKAEEEGLDFFNPGLVRRPDGLWLLVRVSEHVEGMIYGRNKVWACKLNEDMTPEGGPMLHFPDSAEGEQFEDPRGVYWNGQTWVGCVNFTWFDDGTWTGAHQCLGVFRNDGNPDHRNDDGRWNPIVRRDPPVGTNLDRAGDTNGRHNKNWLWFFHEGSLHLIYTSDPWHVVEFGTDWSEQTPHKAEGVKWKYGTVRGGTPPVLVGEHYYTFFHSSLPWRGRFRRYHMGAIAFEAKPPFKPVLWTHEPLLSGSQNDPWQQRKPLVVFPCGALYENDWWTISMGVNDLKCAWVKIPHEDILQSLKPVPPMPGLSLLSAKTERPQYEHIPYQPNGGDAVLTRHNAESAEVITPRESVPAGHHAVPSVPSAQDTADRVFRPEMLPSEVRRQFVAPPTPARFTVPPATEKIDLRPLEGESVEDWGRRLEQQAPVPRVISKEELLARRQVQAAGARAAMAAKRAAGELIGGKKKKRRRKKKH